MQNSKMKFAALCALAAFAAAAAVPVEWRCDVAASNPRQIQAYRGETLLLSCTFLRGGKPIAAPMQTATFCWQTNGMTFWQQTNAVLSGAVVSAPFTPAMDWGAPQYRFFFGVQDAAGINYRANGVISFADSPGATPGSPPPLPGAVWNFADVTVIGAPWATLEEIDAELEGYAPTQDVAAVAAAIPSLDAYATTSNVSAQIAASAAAERATTDADIAAAESNAIAAAVAQFPSLSGYATEAYVQAAIGDIETPDLAGYATRAYADAAASNAQANAVAQMPSLSGYATEAYVQAAIGSIETPDLAGYATRAYADAAASNVAAAAAAKYLTEVPGIYATQGWVLDQIETGGGGYSAGVWSSGYVLDATGVVSAATIITNAIPTPPFSTNTTTYIEGGVTTTVETVTTNYTYEVVTNLAPAFKAFLYDASTSPESAIADAALTGPVFYSDSSRDFFRVSDVLYECDDGTWLEYSNGRWRYYSDGGSTYDCINGNGLPANDISPPSILQWNQGGIWKMVTRGSVLETFPLLYNRAGLAPADYETVSNRAMSAVQPGEMTAATNSLSERFIPIEGSEPIITSVLLFLNRECYEQGMLMFELPNGGQSNAVSFVQSSMLTNEGAVVAARAYTDAAVASAKSYTDAAINAIPQDTAARVEALSNAVYGVLGGLPDMSAVLSTNATGMVNKPVLGLFFARELDASPQNVKIYQPEMDYLAVNFLGDDTYMFAWTYGLYDSWQLGTYPQLVMRYMDVTNIVPPMITAATNALAQSMGGTPAEIAVSDTVPYSKGLVNLTVSSGGTLACNTNDWPNGAQVLVSATLPATYTAASGINPVGYSAMPSDGQYLLVFTRLGQAVYVSVITSVE